MNVYIRTHLGCKLQQLMVIEYLQHSKTVTAVDILQESFATQSDILINMLLLISRGSLLYLQKILLSNM